MICVDPEKPVFAHYCADCRFLGHFWSADLYVCATSLLARLGDDAPDYVSNMSEGPYLRDPLLVEARRRARLLRDQAV